MFQLLKTEGKARRGVFTCAHGTVQTPVFMNVGTQGAIKGALSAADLKAIGCQVELSNTYHLHLRPGDRLVHDLGGLHRFMTWDGPILTDSGGFQVFSLASLRRIKEEGVYFASHIDGHKIFMGPEESMQIQSNLGSDICMAFDECIENPSPREYVEKSCARTARWLERCVAEQTDLLVLDEVIGACGTKLLDEGLLLDFLQNKPPHLEVVLTGRNPSPAMLEAADYVSEICKRKHPFDKGIPAREGIEK